MNVSKYKCTICGRSLIYKANICASQVCRNKWKKNSRTGEKSVRSRKKSYSDLNRVCAYCDMDYIYSGTETNSKKTRSLFCSKGCYDTWYMKAKRDKQPLSQEAVMRYVEDKKKTINCKVCGMPVLSGKMYCSPACRVRGERPFSQEKEKIIEATEESAMPEAEDSTIHLACTDEEIIARFPEMRDFLLPIEESTVKQEYSSINDLLKLRSPYSRNGLTYDIFIRRPDDRDKQSFSFVYASNGVRNAYRFWGRKSIADWNSFSFYHYMVDTAPFGIQVERYNGKFAMKLSTFLQYKDRGNGLRGVSNQELKNVIDYLFNNYLMFKEKFKWEHNVFTSGMLFGFFYPIEAALKDHLVSPIIDGYDVNKFRCASSYSDIDESMRNIPAYLVEYDQGRKFSDIGTRLHKERIGYFFDKEEPKKKSENWRNIPMREWGITTLWARVMEICIKRKIPVVRMTPSLKAEVLKKMEECHITMYQMCILWLKYVMPKTVAGMDWSGPVRPKSFFNFLHSFLSEMEKNDYETYVCNRFGKVKLPKKKSLDFSDCRIRLCLAMGIDIPANLDEFFKPSKDEPKFRSIRNERKADKFGDG